MKVVSKIIFTLVSGTAVLSAHAASEVETHSMTSHSYFLGKYSFCNKTPDKVFIETYDKQNVRLKVPGSWDWDTKKVFVIAPNKCEAIEVGDGPIGNTRYSFRFEVIPYQHVKDMEKDVWHLPHKFAATLSSTVQKDGEKFNIYGVVPYNVDGEWNVEYQPYSIARVYNHWGNTKYYNPKSNNIVSLKDRDYNSATASLQALDRDRVFNIYPGDNGVVGEDVVNKELISAVEKGYQEAMSRSKNDGILTMVSPDYDTKKYISIPIATGIPKLCRVYRPVFTGFKETTATIINPDNKVEVEQTFGCEVSAAPTDKSNATCVTSSFSKAVTDSVSTAIMHGWKAGITTKVSGKKKIPFVAEGGVEVSISAEYSGSNTQTTTKTTTNTYTLPSQTIIAHPGEKVAATVEFLKGKGTGSFSTFTAIDSATLRADVMLDGKDCNSSSPNYISNLRIDLSKIFASQDKRNLPYWAGYDPATKEAGIREDFSYSIDSGLTTRVKKVTMPYSTITKGGYGGASKNNSGSSNVEYLYPEAIN